jgi:hypothetical protein
MPHACVGGSARVPGTIVVHARNEAARSHARRAEQVELERPAGENLAGTRPSALARPRESR